MTLIVNQPPAHEWKYRNLDFGSDVSVLFDLYYIGSLASGIVDIAASGNMTFKHGVLSSEAADTDTELDPDGSGIIDVNSDCTTMQGLMSIINGSDNWRAIPVGLIPDDASYVDASIGDFTQVTGGNCSAAGGYQVKTDDSDSLYVVAGLSWPDSPTEIQRGNQGVHWEAVRVIALSTYASGTSTLQLIACDDVAGTSEVVKTFTTGATTVEVAYPAETSPAVEVHHGAVGKRLVAKLTNSAAMSVVRIAIHGRGYIATAVLDKQYTYTEKAI